MIFDTDVYIVFLDGNFIGIVEDESVAWELADEYTQGTKHHLFDDDVDRVWCHKISVNRFFSKHYTIIDKLEQTTKNHIFCYNEYHAYDGAKTLNKLQLEKERAEAKIRAMEL